MPHDHEHCRCRLPVLRGEPDQPTHQQQVTQLSSWQAVALHRPAHPHHISGRASLRCITFTPHITHITTLPP